MKELDTTMKVETLFDSLFPILRSIAGPGLRKSFEILKDYIPLKVEGVPSGTRVFDWEIPPEWHLREAWIKDDHNKRVLDIQNNALHVINYSAPLDATLSLNELKKVVFTHPTLKEAIPYITSYYRARSGFCMAQSEFDKLREGSYKVLIDSSFVPGELNFGHLRLQGESDKEILISTYLCHPQMANNELSGPLVAAMLYQKILKWKRRRFSYRFLIAPETIGSITYLYRYGKELKQNVYTGIHLTCLGGKSVLSMKESRCEYAPVHKVVRHLVGTGQLECRFRPFDPTSGSDERQFCSPGFNLPICQMARTVYGEYPEYHTSLDDKHLMGIESLMKSAEDIEKILIALELDVTYKNKFPFGEVKLDRRNLYPDMNGPSTWNYSTNDLIDSRQQLSHILWVLNYADGENSLMDIAEKAGESIFSLVGVIERLKKEGILEEIP